MGKLAVVVALGVPAVALAGDPAVDAPLSAWRGAGAAAKHRLVDAMVQQLQASTAATWNRPVPHDEVIRCVDANRAPDRLHMRGHTVTVTVGMATALCLKIWVPELGTARYRMRERPGAAPEARGGASIGGKGESPPLQRG